MPVDDPDSIVPREILVLSNSMAEATDLAQNLVAREILVRRRQTLGFLGSLVLSVFRLPEGRSVAEILAELRQDFPQIIAGPNGLFDPAGSQDVPPRIYARELIGWAETAARRGSGLRLGMVDTGVDSRHPALQDQRVARRSFLPVGTVPASTDHGTAVATLLVGNPRDAAFIGLVPGAELAVAEIFHMAKGERARATTERIALALDWLGAQGVRLVNLSLAGPGDLILGVVIKRAEQVGMVLVAAAGNRGPGAPPAFPAAFKSVIAVTAVDVDMKIYSRANRGDYIDFAAPGVDVWSARAGGGGSYQSGTSFAVPFVTAIIAAHLTVVPGATLDDLLAAMHRCTKDLGAPGKDPIYGWGLVQPTDCAANASANQ